MGILKESLIETHEATNQMLQSASGNKDFLLRMQLKCSKWNLAQAIKLVRFMESVRQKKSKTR